MPSQSAVVFTNKARCRDCYRCLRACPVKAIRMKDGQAYVVEDRCIACGTCVRECPQGAKTIRVDVEKVRDLLAAGGAVAASVAPSFAASFTSAQRKRLPSALRKLGFTFIAETAVGAFHVARKTAQLAGETSEPTICTACPAVVNLVQRYMPQLTDSLARVASPMVAHARSLKKRLGAGSRVVFIGPCAAKKLEAQQVANPAVDCVLTFEELKDWLQKEHIDLLELEESSFDETPGPDSRYFPLSGGLAKTAQLATDLLDDQTMSVHGAHDVMQALETIAIDPKRMLIDPLFCPQGCINGPAIACETTTFQRRSALLEYVRTRNLGKGEVPAQECDISMRYKPMPIAENIEITEEKIREVLVRTGKSAPQDQLNCGVCGYDNCRQKAIAVILGMAEEEMCMPTMRRLAEQRGDRIIESSPNGIVILNEKLEILSMNPTFRRMFLCTDALFGKSIHHLMDPEPFEQLVAGNSRLLRETVSHESYGLICREIYYRLEHDNQYVGLFTDITDSQTSQKKFDDLRAGAMNQARQLLDHQMNLAQSLTLQLGESTAQCEALARRLMELAQEK